MREDVISSVEGLACNDTLNITLDDRCQALLTPGQVLEGDPGCLREADFIIHVYDSRPENGPVVDGHGVFKYEIRRKPEASCSDFDFCWGYVRSEDKSPPVVTCPPDRNLASRSWYVQRVAGTLESGDAVLDGSVSAPCADLPGLDGKRYYDLFRFRVTEKTVYTFEIRSDAGDALAALYQETFNPLNTCRQLMKVAVPTDGQSGYFPAGSKAYRISVGLLPGKDYVLFTSSRQAGATGDYLWAIYTYDTGRVAGLYGSRQQVVQPLLCTNADSILNNPASLDYLGRATATDNCSTPEALPFRDQLIAGEDCRDLVIGRTFTFVDRAGNSASCTQRITVRQPSLEDVILPPRQVYVNCDDQVMLDSKGNPHPMVTGRPFLLTAFGPVVLDTIRCHLGASYRDEAVLQKCGNSRVILRTWKIVDWCHKERELLFSQFINHGDFFGPAFDCPVAKTGEPLSFSTGPFSCFASFKVPLPANITDNCSKTWTIEVRVLLNGTEQFKVFPAGATDYSISGVPTGHHIFRYIVTDECGNETVSDCPFRVFDGVAPTAICNDQLRISIGGGGRGSISARDVDEGSIDNCDPEVDLAIRRVVPAECVEAYRAEVDTMLTLDKATGRYYTPWRSRLDFICCDVGSKVIIELRATDNGGLSNICWLEVPIEDKIPPRCVPPADRSIVCDSLTFIDYSDTAELQRYFGVARAEDNCQAVITELEPKLNRNSCGVGELIRRFQAIDGSGNRSSVCEQRIILTPRHQYSIRFPKDAESTGCSLPLADSLSVSAQACDILAVNRDTSYFEADSDECYKMYIRYRVINWCEYDGETQQPTVIPRDLDGDDFFKEDTHLEAGYEKTDSLALKYPLCDGSWPALKDGDGRPGDIFVVRLFSETDGKKNALPDKILVRGTCSGGYTHAGFLIYRLKLSSDPKAPYCYELYCGPQAVGELCANLVYGKQCWTPGYFEYTQVVKVYDSTPPVLDVADFENLYCAFTNSCKADVDILFEVRDECTPRNIKYVLEYDEGDDGDRQDLDVNIYLKGRFPKQRIKGEFPIGKHSFYLRVIDGCGNFNIKRIPFEVVDCKPPAPVCIERIAAELMPIDDNGDGVIDRAANIVPAKDFIASEGFDCSGVRYSINRVGQRPHPDSTSITVTCNDPAILAVEVYAWDYANNPLFVQPNGKAGGPNYSHCDAKIYVQDNRFNLCTRPGGPSSLAGYITTEDKRSVSGVQVGLSGGASQSFLTQGDGFFMFVGMRLGYDYTITPKKNADFLNGVTTFDLVQIAKHILGVQRLGSPYKLIAADANHSGSVTTLDLIQLRKLILGTELQLPNNTSWRFIPADYVFPNPENPWQSAFPELININDFAAGLPDGNFIGVKVGDINGSARADELVEAEPRSAAGSFNLRASDMDLRAGEDYTVTLMTDELATVQGFQFTLSWDRSALDLAGTENGVLAAEHTALFTKEGLLTASWVSPPVGTLAAKPEAGDRLITLTFRALSDGRLREALSLNSRRTVAEAYDQKDRLLDVRLSFDPQPVAGFRLYQNQPNPFRSATVIGFHQPEAGEATLRITDVAGKEIYRRKEQFPAGYNEWEVHSADLPAGSVLFYTVETRKETATRKMIRL